ncbi:MAG: DUF2007 domain-containing protein [Chthoniobacter sp.]
MKEVFRASSPARVGLCQSVLENAGIPCFVRNETMQQAIPGGLVVAFVPLPEFWPILCVLQDEDYPEAMELLHSARETPPPVSREWRCAACAEIVPGNFTSCWKCEAPQPGGS